MSSYLIVISIGLFLTLDDLLNKWYKLEEAHVQSFQWKELRENFIKDFGFKPDELDLKDAVHKIKYFIIEKPINN